MGAIRRKMWMPKAMLATTAVMTLSASFVPTPAARGTTMAGRAMLSSEPESVTVTSHFVTQGSRIDTDPFFTRVLFFNGATNGKPTDLLFVTVNNSPGGTCFGDCAREPYALGVVYTTWTTSLSWGAFREDGGTLTATGTTFSFNVLVVPKASASAFVQIATESNTIGNSTFINSPLTNGKPTAKLQVTQNFSPGGKSAVRNPHTVGVWYTKKSQRWAIFNEDETTMPLGAAFNVLVGQKASNGGKAQVLTTTTSNRTKTATLFSNIETTGNPNNFTFVTQNWNPGGKGGVYNNAEQGVDYNGSQEEVVNEGRGTMPLGAAFNLLVFSS